MKTARDSSFIGIGMLWLGSITAIAGIWPITFPLVIVGGVTIVVAREES